MTNAVSWSLRIYERLVVLYPEDLRRDYGAEMALAFAEDLAAARREPGMGGVVRVWRCALGEFMRLALPSHVSSPAVRVPAISITLFLAMMSAELSVALRHARDAPAPVHAARALMLLPLFSTPVISLLSVWACRGKALISLKLSNGARTASGCPTIDEAR